MVSLVHGWTHWVKALGCGDSLFENSAFSKMTGMCGSVNCIYKYGFIFGHAKDSKSE